MPALYRYNISSALLLVCLLLMPATGEAQLQNRLAESPSPYLREAAKQPVHWQPWDERAFELAHALDRPILLDIGAIWCHWCHVMDEETYANAEIAQLINAHFVPIKVDRDERPDIDARYQTQVQALSGHGGWPLTVFMVPSGKVFFGGGTFFPEPRYGKLGFKKVLRTIHSDYANRRDAIWQTAESLYLTMARVTSAQVQPGELNETLSEHTREALIREFDGEFGGFGKRAKFPQAGVIELALRGYSREPDPKLLEVVTRTLDGMAAGGIHDHIGGGFHRYTVDRAWRVPHFEKLLSNQAQILRDYLMAYQATGYPRYREVAEGIIRYVQETLSDQPRGGFYAHQDADSTRHDDGDYYTWTEEEARKALSPQQRNVVIPYFDVKPEGEMNEKPERNVLWIATTPAELSGKLGLSEAVTRQLIETGQKRLLKVRRQRRAPYVDRTILADRNGMMVSAYLHAYRALDRDELKTFAFASLNFLLDHLYVPGRGVYHAYADGKPTADGLLGDQIHMAAALVDAFEVSGEQRYIKAAMDIMNTTFDNFADADGVLFDAPAGADNKGVLGLRTKPYSDNAAPGVNPLAARTLNRLYHLTHDKRSRQRSRAILEGYAGSAEHGGRWLSSYALAVDAYLHPPVQAITIGKRSAPQTLALWNAALKAHRPGLMVAAYDPAELDLNTLPPAVAAAARVNLDDQKPKTYVCVGLTCSLPTSDPKRVKQLVENFGPHKTVTK